MVARAPTAVDLVHDRHQVVADLVLDHHQAVRDLGTLALVAAAHGRQYPAVVPGHRQPVAVLASPLEARARVERSAARVARMLALARSAASAEQLGTAATSRMDCPSSDCPS